MDVGYSRNGWVGDNDEPLKMKTVHIEATVPGKQKLTIDDPKGIEFRGLDEVGLPVIKAETIVVEDLTLPPKKPGLFERLQNFWHGLGKER